MNFKSKYLSNNTKVGASLDVSRQDANCINSCHAAAYCYINDNIQDKINPGYKAKMKRNFKLISGPNFVKVIKKEILTNNIHSMRFFSNGDLIFNDMEKSKTQLLNIFNLCDELPKREFWIISRNMNTVLSVLYTQKKPDNLNIILSIPQKAITPGFKNQCHLLKVQLSFITDNVKLSNCPASKSKRKINSCAAHGCDLCLKFDKKPRIFLIHGKNNIHKFKALKNSKDAIIKQRQQNKIIRIQSRLNQDKPIKADIENLRIDLEEN
jgi:hypothetical protein